MSEKDGHINKKSSYSVENGKDGSPFEGRGAFHILVIRLSAMGDVAMTVPVLSQICEYYPNIKITVLTRAFFKPMFSQLPRVEVYEADVKGRHKGVRGLWRLYQELKGLEIDAVADLHHVLRSNILKRFFVFGGFPFFQINKGRSEKKALTATKRKVFKALKTTHLRYADVFAQLGYPLDLTAVPLLSKEQLSKKTLKVIGSDSKLARGMSTRHSAEKTESISMQASEHFTSHLGSKKWIGIAPFAAFQGKMYPSHLMKKVIEGLDTTEKYSLLLFGGGLEEQNQLEAWENQFPQCISIAGKLSFTEELALISNLDLMVSMDSGNGHLAAMYGIQVISLWGVTHPYAGFYPFGQDMNNALLSDRAKYPLIPTSIYGNKIPNAYESVMATIRPDEVVSKIEEVLSKK